MSQTVSFAAWVTIEEAGCALAASCLIVWAC